MKSQRRPPMHEALERRVLQSATVPQPSAALPRPDHVVVLIEEDHSYSQLFGPPPAGALQTWPVAVPGVQNWDVNLRSLEKASASFTQAHSVGSTNLVDYQAIFSGLKLAKNATVSPTAPNIASELTDAGLTFGGYAEGLPSVGYTGASAGDYSTTHNPWLPFSNFPKADAQPFGKIPDDSWASLPTVSYVIPGQSHNMHSGTVFEADQWYKDNIKPYADWAMKHNSLLIITWDESHQYNDSIPTLFYGPMVKPGHYAQPITQENVLRTIEDMYNLTPTGSAANATPITQIFKGSTPSNPPTRRKSNPPAHSSPRPHHATPFSNAPIA